VLDILEVAKCRYGLDEVIAEKSVDFLERPETLL